MKKLLLLFTMIAILGACVNQNKKVAELPAPISVDSLMSVAKDYVGKEVSVKGTAIQICPVEGKTLMLFSGCPKHGIKAVASDSIGKFDTLLEGCKVCVKAIVEETRIDSAYLAQWEAKIKEDMEKKPACQELKEGKQDAKCKKEKGCGEHKEKACMEAKDSMPKPCPMSKVMECRKQVEASAEGYIPVYSLKIISIAKCADSEAKPCCQKGDSAKACNDTAKTCKHTCGKDCKHKEEGCQKEKE
jgi:hypothetical protein